MRSPRKQMRARWRLMLKRCTDPTCPDFRFYGARGITVCDRWTQFQNYLQDVGFPPHQKAMLARLDVTEPYRPENCRWTVAREVMRRSRRAQKVEADGVMIPIAEAAAMAGRSYATTIARRWRHESPSRILSPGNLTRRDALMLHYLGETLTLAEWTRRLNLNYSVAYGRHRRGMPPEKVLSP